MNRWKASALHLLLSVLIIGGIALAAFLLWYPYGLYRIAGHDRLLLIMLGIDLVAGPLLTLVVYKVGKRSLRFDLAVIALCQLAFLGYGLHTLWASRPVFLVASDVRFNLVFASELSADELAGASRPEWQALSWAGPRLVGVKAPADERERQALLKTFMTSGIDIDKMPRYYVEFESVAPDLLASARADQNQGEALKVPVVSRYGAAWMRISDSDGSPKESFSDR